MHVDCHLSVYLRPGQRSHANIIINQVPGDIADYNIVLFCFVFSPVYTIF